MKKVRESLGCCFDSPDGVSSHSLPNPDESFVRADALALSAGESASVVRTVSGSGRLSLTAALPAQIGRSPQLIPQPLWLADSSGDLQCAKLGAGAVISMGI